MKTYAIIHIMNGLFETLVENQKPAEYKKGEWYQHPFSKYEGIYFQVQIRSEFYGYDKDGMTHHPEWEGSSGRYMHVLMLHPHSVFTCVTDYHSFKIPQTGWKNTSNHNSCWRSGCDELTDLMFTCFDEAHKNMPERLFHSRSDDTTIDLRINLGGSIFKFVEAFWEYQDDGYHKDIHSVKEIKKTITC